MKTSCSFRYHCKIGFLIRLVMILYGTVHDKILQVKYTDIDYKVFTDTARHVMNGTSPYDRHTYRYSPFLAYILTPNIIIHPAFGKFLFSFCDILLCFFVWNLLKADKVSEKNIYLSVYLWLYNPVTIIISTRGNADSLSSLLVLSTLLAMKNRNYSLAGFLHGISIHFRLYPIAFSLCLYLSIPGSKSSRSVKYNGISILTKLFYRLFPNYNRIKLVTSCVFTLFSVTGIFYYLYGYTFLFESFLYHLKRRDTRHNFSVFFYLQYLSSTFEASIVEKLLTVLPQIILISVLSFVYGCSMNHIYFCQLLIAFVIVTYNSVLTCQYFIWFLSLVPLVLPHLKFSLKETVLSVTLWGVAQAAWLCPAYLLEFKSQNTFVYIWFQGLIFFSVNVFVITRLIKWYNKPVKLD